MLSLLWNKEDENHLDYLKDKLAGCNEAVFCTAFFKKSSLTEPVCKEIRRLGKKLKFFVGIDFYQTEPAALRFLLDSKVRLYIVHSEESTVTFHPKMFVFKNDSTVSVAIGSANMTSGGLESNYELSMSAERELDSVFANEIFEYIKKIESDANTRLCDRILIDEYEQEYDENRIKESYSKLVITQRLNIKRGKEYHNIERALDVYKRNGEFKNSFKERLEDYAEAKRLLNNPEFSVGTFHEALGWLPSRRNYVRLKYKSGSIRQIRELVSSINKCRAFDSEAIYERFCERAKDIRNIGKSVFTDLMVIFNPKKHILLNSRIVEVIVEELNIVTFSHKNASNFNFEDYRLFCGAVRCLQKEWNLSCPLEVDMFLSMYLDRKFDKSRATKAKK